MSAVFLSREFPSKTEQQKKISNVALRVNKARREYQKSGPVVSYRPMVAK